MKKFAFLIAAGTFSLAVAGCNSYDSGDRALGGAAIGGLGGAAVGAAVTGDVGGALAGGAIGALGGAAVGAATTPQRRYYRSRDPYYY